MLLFALKRVLDYPLTLGLTVVLMTCVLAVNALSDIALAAIDPRMRAATSGRSA
jgi:ABC-type dipeptide/oligopeptide/nickel transport system permease component